MTMTFRALTAALVLATLSPVAALSQGAQLAFGGIRADPSLPVEVTADQLAVNQTDGTATFTGNVLVAQGDMRLSAAEVLVEYGNDDRTRIERLHATGGVTLVSGTDAAEAAEAVYTINSGDVVMTGNVLLTQGANTVAGQRLTVDLKSGTGRMEGRVKTVLQPGDN
ncbi:lipopolysaccharide transport periplasmic protein LptA [Defluviimonas sp. SAOS-178_SWC]|uniref:lipopolysaccharide transport periplasmic protein LptA n=1 Tax=Defluviimonas sp. SAOS-178_SWC TaxID=3121287 RepID=UPI0032218594